MTGIADLYLVITRPHSKQAWTRFRSSLQQKSRGRFDDDDNEQRTRFVVMAWKRTGSNLLCGILLNHPEITMHNELFNPIDIFTYYQDELVRRKSEGEGDGGDCRWNTLGRDLYPQAFLHHIWKGRFKDDGKTVVKSRSKAVGFKSFPDHWTEANNYDVWEKEVMEDHLVKKVILVREDELAVYVSMKRVELTGNYMTLTYPKALKIHVHPAAFQRFVNNYWDTYHRRYKSVFEKRDTFWISYEQIVQEESFENDILPLLWKFLGVDDTQPLKKLRETVKQADAEEDLSQVITNYEELEFCFRHTQVKHFKIMAETKNKDRHNSMPNRQAVVDSLSGKYDGGEGTMMSWSILLPICSRVRLSEMSPLSTCAREELAEKTNKNRFAEIIFSSQHRQSDNNGSTNKNEEKCWKMLQDFATSLRDTSSPAQLEQTECIVGIDVDDAIFNANKDRIRSLLPCKVVFVSIMPEMYGRVCRIWNHLAKAAKNDFIVLLGDDVILKDKEWQRKVVCKFHHVAKSTGLPFGAACVALMDESFPGFPTFPVIHRWHIQHFTSLLPKQFVNQGGDPYLFELYSRFSASSFAIGCRLENRIGGDGDARYKKHEINWKGQVLRLNMMHLKQHIDMEPKGICMDVVVPSFRTNNSKILESIKMLSCSVQAYVKIWIVVDNPDPTHYKEVLELSHRINKERFDQEGNFFVNVLTYGENRGASYARNFGYNYSTADWVLFLDDDVIPNEHILDAYIGAIWRYPDAKVFVGKTELPVATNT